MGISDLKGAHETLRRSRRLPLMSDRRCLWGQINAGAAPGTLAHQFICAGTTTVQLGSTPSNRDQDQLNEQDYQCRLPSYLGTARVCPYRRRAPPTHRRTGCSIAAPQSRMAFSGASSLRCRKAQVRRCNKSAGQHRPGATDFCRGGPCRRGLSMSAGVNAMCLPANPTLVRSENIPAVSPGTGGRSTGC